MCDTRIVDQNIETAGNALGFGDGGPPLQLIGYIELDGEDASPAVCTEKSNPRVVMVKSTQDGVRTYETGSRNRPRNRRIFV
jgi:hypothetical protein